MNPSSELRQLLVRFRDRVRRRQRARGWISAVAMWLVLALGAGLLDAWAGFEAGGRGFLFMLLLASALLSVVLSWWRARRFDMEAAASRVDAFSADTRGHARIASDLSLVSDSEKESSSLEAYLARKTVLHSLEKLRALPSHAGVTPGEFRRPVLWATVAALAFAGVALWQPAATALIARRLTSPFKDLPPYSPFQFEVEPAELAVIYGKTLSVATEISGASVEGKEVRLLTRSAGGGEISRLPVFRESGQRFTQKLEGVTAPMEIAFAIGRARSVWRPVEVLWEPVMESAEFTITPPKYAGAKPVAQSFSGEIQGLRGSQVVLKVSSNRPLSGGMLEARVEGSAEVVERISGVPLEESPNTVEYRWAISRDCRWTLDLRDVRGTRMAEPAKFVQRLVPDEKPVIDLLSPGPFARATATSKLTLEWSVEDDLGLERAEWVRTADGFRDRARDLPGAGGERKLQVKREIDLATLGVQPGQTLEFLVEARDRNPSLMGVNSSAPARVQIISEEDYAEEIRIRTSIEEFAARYEVLRNRLDAAVAALDALAEAARSGEPNRIAAARQKARQMQEQAADWFGEMADDFPAFATDKELSEMADGLRDELEKNAAELGKDPGWEDPAKAEAMAKAMKDRLQQGSEELDRQQSGAEELVKIARVAEMGAELQAIHQEQKAVSEELAKIAEEMMFGMTDNRHKISQLRQRQLHNSERLQAVEEQLPARIAELPDSAKELKEGTQKVLDGLKGFQVTKQMDDAVAKMGQGNLMAASADALLARANLDQILNDPANPFCEMCQGQMPGGLGSSPSHKQALQEMMGALRQRAAGEGPGPHGATGPSGQGFGAKGGSGTSMQGTQLSVPLIGPPRLQLNGPQIAGQTGDRTGTGRGGTESPEAVEAASSTMGPSDTGTAQGHGPRLEEVPMKYRDAVKQYFSQETPPALPGTKP